MTFFVEDFPEKICVLPKSNRAKTHKHETSNQISLELYIFISKHNSYTLKDIDLIRKNLPKLNKNIHIKLKSLKF